MQKEHTHTNSKSLTHYSQRFGLTALRLRTYASVPKRSINFNSDVCTSHVSKRTANIDPFLLHNKLHTYNNVVYNDIYKTRTLQKSPLLPSSIFKSLPTHSQNNYFTFFKTTTIILLLPTSHLQNDLNFPKNKIIPSALLRTTILAVTDNNNQTKKLTLLMIKTIKFN